MSQETSEWLNRNVLIGKTNDRGNAWHYRASQQGDEPNHYPDFIPVADVQRRLFDWTAVKVPTFFEFNGERISTKEIVVVASDTGEKLGSHSDKYQIHGYTDWLLNHVSTILDNGDLGVTSAGLLKKRAVAWAEVSVPETIGTKEGVSFRPNLLACTSLNGTVPTTYKRTVQLTVCDNTLNVARSEQGQEIRIKHTANSLGRLESARDVLNIVHQDAEAFQQEVARLCQWHVSGKDWNLMLKEVIPITDDMGKASVTRAENLRDDLTNLWGASPMVTPWKGTAFGVVQAVNTYRHHYQSIKTTAWDGGNAERNMFNALTGNTGENDAKFLSALELVQSNS